NNKWYQDQWSVVLTAPNDSALAKQINNSETTLVDRLMEKEFERWKEEIYDRGEQLAVEDSLWKNHGWKIRIQHDWNTILDTVYDVVSLTSAFNIFLYVFNYLSYDMSLILAFYLSMLK